MEQCKPLYSEEDIRTKIVTAWLADHGFGPSDISVEYSFEIRLGRKILLVGSEKPEKSSSQVFRPRADILVRSLDGRNLLIVEVKAPDEPLDDGVREQGICYARLLRTGGIAPFVVLTNGRETKIYDSITEELINGAVISLDHPHVKAGFRVSSDDIAIKAEAIETFISLSPDNLIEFCKQQVAYRMCFLKDEDPHSGKKFIPSLYVERGEAKENLVELLDEKKRRVVVVIGPPQVGKTNFICHTVEEHLERGLPCLFYPAIGMEKGLLNAICEDFKWILGDSSSAYNIIHHKLQRILRRTHQRLCIFIDGWNEADLALARTIDRESERLSGYDVACVISMTNVAANRLLKDEVGNPSHIAQAVGVSVAEIPVFEMEPTKSEKEKKKLENPSSKWSRVYINSYSDSEIEYAYRKYAGIFNVQVDGLDIEKVSHNVWIPSSHIFTKDPFLLRVAMEQFRGQVLPRVLEEPDLLEKSIELKSSRATDLRDKCVPEILSILADEMFSRDLPIRQSVAMKCWGLPATDEPPKGLFEAALLAKVCDERKLPAVDFYYGRERDFVVACWARNWTSKLKNGQESVIRELSLAGQTPIGLEALRWFLKQPIYREYLEYVVPFFNLYENPLIRRVLLSLLSEVLRWDDKDQTWIRDIVNKGAKDSDILVRVETVKLVAILTEEWEKVAEIIGHDEELISHLLMIEEEYPLGEPGVGHLLLDTFERLHWEEIGQDHEDSTISLLMKNLLDHNLRFVRIAAAKVLGYIAPDIFLFELTRLIKKSTDSRIREKIEEYADGVPLVIRQYGERYYGSYCPGWLESLKDDQEELYEEYKRMCELCIPIIGYYWPKDFCQDLRDLLDDLQPNQSILDAQEGPDAKEVIAQKSALRYQLPLPFDEPDTNREGNQGFASTY
jgi:hypothetical protein